MNKRKRRQKDALDARLMLRDSIRWIETLAKQIDDSTYKIVMNSPRMEVLREASKEAHDHN